MNSCLWYLYWSCWIIGKTNISDKFSKFQCTFMFKINVSTQERHLKVTSTAYTLIPLCCHSKENMHFVSYLIKYLIEEIGALCKLRPQGMLGPVHPEISSEGLRTDKEGQRGQHTLRRKTFFISMQFWRTAQVINSNLSPHSNTSVFDLSCSLTLHALLLNPAQ